MLHARRRLDFFALLQTRPPLPRGAVRLAPAAGGRQRREEAPARLSRWTAIENGFETDVSALARSTAMPGTLCCYIRHDGRARPVELSLQTTTPPQRDRPPWSSPSGHSAGRPSRSFPSPSCDPPARGPDGATVVPARPLRASRVPRGWAPASHQCRSSRRCCIACAKPPRARPTALDAVGRRPGAARLLTWP